MLKVPNTSREIIQKYKSSKWDNVSFDSSRQMAKLYFDQVIVPESPKPQIKTKPKKKLVPVKERKKSSPRPLPFNESLFFHNHMYGIENRTVNSLADVGDLEQSDSDDRPQRKRRKPKYIDSEVELMMNKIDDRPRIKYSDIAPKHSDKNKTLITMKKAMLQQVNGLDIDVSNKKSTKAKGTNVTSVPVRKSSPKRRKQKDDVLVDQHAHFVTKYPILMDTELVQKFLNVEMTNNQKGRLRQIMREILRGTSPTELPDILNNKIQAILNSSVDLTDTDLRKIRILYNMLKKSTLGDSWVTPANQTKEKKKEPEDKNIFAIQTATKKPDEKQVANKEKKCKKRYVVFVGNLPSQVTKSEILQLFHDIQNDITDIRIPKVPEEGKCAIAYVELKNRHSYEIALSKHHWMVGKRRINVLYTAQKNTKLTSGDIKARQAKLLALQKKGKLIGSISLNKKRSQRRAKQRKALSEKQKEASSKLLRVTNY